MTIPGLCSLNAWPIMRPIPVPRDRRVAYIDNRGELLAVPLEPVIVHMTRGGDIRARMAVHGDAIIYTPWEPVPSEPFTTSY